MRSEFELSVSSAATFVFLVASQILATSLLPRTEGFTNLNWTLACLGIYLLSFWSLAHMIHSGMPLSQLVPIVAAVVPLATIAVGVFIYKEAASLSQVLLLCIACGMIGAASAIK